MKNDWRRGYGQRYKHLVIREEKAVNGNYVKTYFACGQSTDCAIDKLADWNRTVPKCPLCLRIYHEQ